MFYKIKRDELARLLGVFAQRGELVAPIKKGASRFEHIKPEQVKDIYLESNTYFPAKEFFFRKRESIFHFKNGKITMPKIEEPKRVFFGLRRCDLNAIMHQDKVFLEQVHDPYYAAQRKNSILIGYHCFEAPSKYCFCGTLELADYYDLIIYDKGSNYIIEVGSQKGQDLIDSSAGSFQKTDVQVSAEEKRIKNADRLKRTDIKALYDNPLWQKGVDKCLSCAACTNLCPTCYCFEFHDTTKTSNINEGERVRQWSSCQLQDFTRVAQDHVNRQKREERFKHRIYHQLDYFKEKNGVNLCVGCGRCIQGCPTRIDFVDIINNMK